MSRLAELRIALADRLIGQAEAVEEISPYIAMYEANLTPESRPAGVFMLLGPTGTGKTHTVETVARALHGSSANLLNIDCGEYQLDHEVSKLVGAPPGYLGHRETQPVLSQAKLSGVRSDKSHLAVVLFDEVEKAAPSMARMLLGILDKARLRMGDGSATTFENCLIFMTSNVGATELSSARRSVGFASPSFSSRQDSCIATAALRRRFAPEFVNRIDKTLVYQRLTASQVNQILDLQLRDLNERILARFKADAFKVIVEGAARKEVLRLGVSDEWGVRELRRVIQTKVMLPISSLVLEKKINGGSTVSFKRTDLKPIVSRAAVTA